MITDTHAHLDYSQYDEDRKAVIERAMEAAVSKIITIGIGKNSIPKTLEIAEDYSNALNKAVDADIILPEIEAKINKLSTHHETLLKKSEALVAHERDLTARLPKLSIMKNYFNDLLLQYKMTWIIIDVCTCMPTKVINKHFESRSIKNCRSIEYC